MIAWQRRDMPGALAFSVAMLLAAWFTFFSTLQISSRDYDFIVFWGKMKQPAFLFIPVPALMLALQYSGKQQWVTFKSIAILCIIPTISVFMLIFNPNNLFITAINRHDQLGFLSVSFEFGLWHRLYFIQSMLISIMAFLILIYGILNSANTLQRKQLIVLLMGFVIMVLVIVANNNAQITFLINALALPIEALIMGFAVLRFRLSDIMPIPYDHILMNMPNGFIVLDGHDEIRSINPIMCNILHIKEEDVLNRPLHTMAIFYDMVQPLLHKGGKLEIEWQQQHYNLIVSGLPQNFMTAKSTLILLEDIGEQKKAQEKLQQQLTQLEIIRQFNDEISSSLSINQILATSLDAVVRICSADNGFIALTDKDDKTRIKQQISNNYPKINLDAGIIKRVMDSGTPELVTRVETDPDYVSIIPTTKSQMTLPLLSNGIINLETAKPDCFTNDTFQFVQVLIDRIAITIDKVKLYQHIEEQYEELQKTHQEVSRLESLKTDMIRLAAHDLRNPLSVIHGYATFLQARKELVDEKLHSIFDQIAASTTRMEAILSNFLSIERIESLMKDSTHETFDFVKDVQKAIAEYAPQIPEDTKSLTLKTNLQSAAVYGDRPQIYEAVANLISNAIKYTPQDGKITVSIAIEDTNLIYTVVDTGFGIPEHKYDTLFKPFSRIKTIETHNIVGVGLGLHLVKNIIERANGEIIFSSVYGEGSTFGFKLPISTQKSPVIEATSLTPSPLHE